ncbi:MAG: M50 family metallopeptidase [Nanoarchaeota archaeon]|nr:M50 family metallopeptidase [Nanoarchaeota archaeon]MBU1004215.1 M50 family metallopeptidase [Nanoarchaeota archaeon]MBU1945835.1 M50 family metallopeptidase [Nanoarchaeota archaeon]
MDLVIMTFAIGYIFSDFFRREPLEGYDPLKYYKKPQLWENIKFASMIAAPAVVLHELAHKFAAMSFGASATLHAPYFWYAIVILLKMMRFPLLFFVGGYVSHTALPPLESSIVAVAGPLTNLILWIACLAVVKYRLINRKYYKILVPAAKINMFLFIFNMIPLPGFDGYHFISSLFSAFA